MSLNRRITSFSMFIMAFVSLFPACTTLDQTPYRLTREFDEATRQEHTLSTEILTLRSREEQDVQQSKARGMTPSDADMPGASAQAEQNASIKMVPTIGQLIRIIDKETRGSRERQHAILLEAVRKYGKFSFLQELNRYYHALSPSEFDVAARQSGEKPSALYIE